MVEKFQRIGFMVFNDDFFRRIIKDITGFLLNFLDNISAGLQVGNRNIAVFIGAVFAVRCSYYCAVRFCNFEQDVGKRSLCYSVHFLNQQTAQRFVFKSNFFADAAFDFYRFYCIIETVSFFCFRFSNRITAGWDMAQTEHTVRVGRINSRRILASLGAFYFKFYSRNRFFRYAVYFLYDKTTFWSILKIKGLRIAVSNNYCLRLRVEDIIVQRFCLCDDICPRLEFTQRYLPVCIGRINTVTGGKSFVCGNQFAGRGCDFKFYALQRFTGFAVSFLDNKTAFRLIKDIHRIRLMVFYLNCFRGIVQNISRRCLQFSDNIAARF